jgi:predicted small metal-binding protein
MSKELRCGDLMSGCSAVVEGKDEKEVMAKAVEHAKSAHGLDQISPELAGKVQAAIHDKEAPRSA